MTGVASRRTGGRPAALGQSAAGLAAHVAATPHLLMAGLLAGCAAGEQGAATPHAAAAPAPAATSGTADIPVEATVPDVFEVELHDSRKVLFQLRVA